MREAVGVYMEGNCDGIVAARGGTAIDLSNDVAVYATPLVAFSIQHSA